VPGPLHDVLAHNISLINVQAGVALHLMDQRPGQARTALSVIKQASKEALGEMRSALAVLRGERYAAHSPMPGLDRLDELTGRLASRTAGAYHGDRGTARLPSVTRRLIGEFALRAQQPRQYPQLAALTEREREVLTLAGQGLSNEEIAAKLVVSPATAKTHVSRAMVKLAARDRAQLVVIAYESGLVRPGWLT
jgi:DNA-binding CsgD family transcriptional regulator